MSLLIHGMRGLGDNIYQRAFVRAVREDVYLSTPWPELYEDLPIRFVREDTPLRTQAKNISRQPASRWREAPADARSVRVSYGTRELASGSIIDAMNAALPLNGAPLVMDLPAFPDPGIKADKPIALVRPVTVRTEWRNEARNTYPESIQHLAAAMMDRFFVVSVADLERGKEWLVTPEPPAHLKLHGGELDISRLMGLVQRAAVIVGGVGWIVPAAIAAKTPAFIVLGGHGGHNAPEKITDPRMDLSKMTFAMPDKFCRCADMGHGCDKTITDLMPKFNDWLGAHGY